MKEAGRAGRSVPLFSREFFGGPIERPGNLCYAVAVKLARKARETGGAEDEALDLEGSVGGGADGRADGDRFGGGGDSSGRH